MKFIKIIKSKENTYKYATPKALQELKDRELVLKNYTNDKENRNLNYDNKELKDLIDSAEYNLNSLKSYLDMKNHYLNNLKKHIIDTLLDDIIDTVESAEKFIGEGKVETKEEVKEQIRQALENIK